MRYHFWLLNCEALRSFHDHDDRRDRNDSYIGSTCAARFQSILGALELRLSGTRERRGEAAVIAVTRLLHGRNGGGNYWGHSQLKRVTFSYFIFAERNGTMVALK